MSKIYFNINGEKVVFNDPTETQISDWYAVIEDDMEPDKDKFILNKFNNDFPNSTVDDVSLIYGLASRSKIVREWYALANASFILDVQCPEYYKDAISNSEYEECSLKISMINRNIAEKTKEEQELAEKYKLERLSISNKWSKKNESLVSNTKVRIMTLTSEELPVSIQLLIEKYTPSSASDQNAKKRYAKEMLIRYKLLLLNNTKDMSLEQLNAYLLESSKY